MLEKYKDVMVVDELCEVLRCGRYAAYRLLHNKEIASLIVGGKYIIPKTEVLKFLTKNST